MTYEQDELPVFLVVAAPAGHAGEADAVLDDVEELAIGELLSSCQSHIRRGRVHMLAHLGFSAAVIGVTDGAMIGEVVPAFGDIERSRAERIFHLLGGSRSRQGARLPGQECLEPAGFRVGAETMSLDGPGEPGCNAN